PLGRTPAAEAVDRRAPPGLGPSRLLRSREAVRSDCRPLRRGRPAPARAVVSRRPPPLRGGAHAAARGGAVLVRGAAVRLGAPESLRRGGAAVRAPGGLV